MALLYFKEQAVNVNWHWRDWYRWASGIRPMCSDRKIAVITSGSLDHQETLGGPVEIAEAAHEKNVRETR